MTIKGLFTRKEGYPSKRVALASGLPQHSHISSFFLRRVYKAARVTRIGKLPYLRARVTLAGGLRWPNTVFARPFADAIQRAHKDWKKQTYRQQSDHFIYSIPALSVLFFSIIERSVLMALVFYHKYMLEKVKTERTQKFSAFSLLPKEPS